MRRNPLRAVLAGMFMGPVLAMPVHAEGDTPLGRLFTTPQERAAMEAARRQIATPPEPQPLAMPEPTPTVTPRPLTDISVNGVVVRSGGRSTVWVNGTNSYDGDLGAHQVRVDPRQVGGDRVPLQLDEEGTVRLKPGQTLSRSDLRK